MNLYEMILGLLVAQFQGVRKDGLNQLARSIALTVDTEEKAKEVVGELTADQVKQFVTDWRKDADAEITKANQTYEAGLKEKYDFVTKGGTPPKPQEQPGNLTEEAVQKIVAEAVKQATEGLTAQVATMQGNALAATRREELVKALGDNVPTSYKNAVLAGFEGRTFADDNAFAEYLNKTKENVAAFTQELADRGLSLHEKPVLGTVNKDGVSSGVESYIKDKADEAKGGGMSGKEV